jgi:predicted transcriptional regulator
MNYEMSREIFEEPNQSPAVEDGREYYYVRIYNHLVLSDLSDFAFRLYAYFCMKATAKNYATVLSQKSIANEIKRSRKRVNEGIKELVKADLLMHEEREQGEHGIHRYVLLDRDKFAVTRKVTKLAPWLRAPENAYENTLSQKVKWYRDAEADGKFVMSDDLKAEIEKIERDMAK